MLQPGARGGVFTNNDFPGYRGQGDRINRTNNKLDISAHDVLNNKYGLDPRLPSLFRYGWAYGYNQIVIPKGRLVAADPYLMVLDTDTMHFFNDNAVEKAYDSKLGSADVELAGEANKKVGVFHAIADEAFLEDPDRFRYLLRLQEKAMEKVRVDLVDEVTGASVGNVIIDRPISKHDTPVMFTGTNGSLFKVVYADIHKGLIEIQQVAVHTEVKDFAIKVSYVKRGQAGVPTNLDWDGVVGTAIVLMNK